MIPNQGGKNKGAGVLLIPDKANVKISIETAKKIPTTPKIFPKMYMFIIYSPNGMPRGLREVAYW